MKLTRAWIHHRTSNQQLAIRMIPDTPKIFPSILWWTQIKIWFSINQKGRFLNAKMITVTIFIFIALSPLAHTIDDKCLACKAVAVTFFFFTSNLHFNFSAFQANAFEDSLFTIRSENFSLWFYILQEELERGLSNVSPKIFSLPN